MAFCTLKLPGMWTVWGWWRQGWNGTLAWEFGASCSVKVKQKPSVFSPLGEKRCHLPSIHRDTARFLSFFFPVTCYGEQAAKGLEWKDLVPSAPSPFTRCGPMATLLSSPASSICKTNLRIGALCNWWGKYQGRSCLPSPRDGLWGSLWISLAIPPATGTQRTGLMPETGGAASLTHSHISLRQH